MILQETIDLVLKKYHAAIEGLTITDVQIGLFMTVIRLSDGSAGTSSTLMPKDSDIHCKKSMRDYGDFTPLKITGKTVTELFKFPTKNSLIQCMKIAALNAVSSNFIESGPYKVVHNTDPLDLMDLHSGKTITVVGAFQSYIDKISKTNNQLYVLELNEDAFFGEDKKYYVPANEYPRVLPQSDIVLITGLTLVNNTLDDLLAKIKPGAQVSVLGTSIGFIPDVIFKNKVNIVGTMKITDAELLLKMASEAAAGYHMFKYCAEKICIVND